MRENPWSFPPKYLKLGPELSVPGQGEHMGVWEISVQTYTCKAEKLAVNLDFLKKCFNDQAVGTGIFWQGSGLWFGALSTLWSGNACPWQLMTR